MIGLLENDNYGTTVGKTLGKPKKVVLHYVSSPPLLILSGVFILVLSCYAFFRFVWQPTALELGIEKGDLGYLYGVFTAGSALGAFSMGRISKKVDGIMVLILCFTVVATGFFTIYLANGTIVFLVGLIQIALGYRGFLPMFHSFTNVFIPNGVRASANSLISTVTNIGIMIFQLGIGLSIDQRGLARTNVFGLELALLGICTLFVLRRGTNS